ncbi:hypothetical protein A1OE_105 [Candidatus Endolissoclinum faulkneri L2]|uniref:Uncharacterized protein n=1 Tax=Candidatus Endolissoclinum faulkneri L2 TaxID=1193729 RepID=K7ZC56_9PROT|nr:hypothetical protein A1OE_105 [Candidatus Endolissoclinum faulkneri L2]
MQAIKCTKRYLFSVILLLARSNFSFLKRKAIMQNCLVCFMIWLLFIIINSKYILTYSIILSCFIM